MDVEKHLTRGRDQLRRVFNRHESTASTATDLEFLTTKVEAMFELDRKIQESLSRAEDFDVSAYDRECEEADVYKKKWICVRNRLQQQKNSEIELERKHNINKKHSLNLPKLEIRIFDDNPKSWLAFWGQYKKIHEDSNMDAETKFQYLGQAMAPGSKASALVESFPPTEENYVKVIETLKQRFAKNEDLIEIYIRELLLLMFQKNSLTLECLYDRIVANLQVLESLGIFKDKYECILFPLLESALPESTLLAWSKLSCQNGESKLNGLLKFLQTEVEAERRVTRAKNNFTGTEAACILPTASCLVSESQQVKQKCYTKDSKEECFFCDKSHSTFVCAQASSIKLEQKKDAIKKKGGCYNCLKKGHLAKNCKAFIKCMHCSKRHLLILCPSLHSSQPKTQEPIPDNTEVSNNFSSYNRTTLLQTLIVNVSGGQQKRKVRALIDSGSQKSYVKSVLAKEMGLQVVGMECLSHSLFGGVKKATQTHQVYSFEVSSLDNTYVTKMTGLGQDVLCGELPRVQNTGLLEQLHKHNIILTDADNNGGAITDIGLLIGSDYLGLILDDNRVHISDTLVAVNTKLGWTLQGPVQSIYSNKVAQTYIASAMTGMEDTLEFLWDLETLGIKDPYNESIKSNEHLNISVNDTGRYEVQLLWKDSYPEVEPNFEVARKRLDGTTKKLSTSGNLLDYHNVFEDWIKEGIIEPVQSDNYKEGHYLPHHAVIKMERVTTKIRPVFDASSKDKKGLSLNMCIEKGKNLIEVIPKLILLFRAGKYGVVSDIRKAFLQISVSPQDRKYLKMLWWKDPTTKEEILTYQHTRVPFGVVCSPFLLASTIKYHLEKHADTYPDTVARLNDSFYVDNCVTSFNTKAAVDKFVKESIDIMERGKFDLRGWVTNTFQQEEFISVLGMQWDRYGDDLYCNFNLKSIPEGITKRSLLSITQQIFDPIGFLCPVTLVPKLITQKAWKLNTGWDEVIPMELEKEYNNWIETINYLRECRIPRRCSEFPLDACSTTVHVFSDASKDAYSGCVFLRTEYENQVTVRLLLAKSRVAPIKRQMTLPRLELMGALIASRLYREVVSSGLLADCRDLKTYCWTDSAVVLAWIQRQDTWKTFITNRVKEICTNTNKEEWRHLPGAWNPADLPSRGCTSKALLEACWWTGPHWLYLDKEKWPKSTVNEDETEKVIRSELTKHTLVNLEITVDNFSEKLLYFNQYSKIVRLVARLLRLSPRIRRVFDISSKRITCEEYRNAEEVIIKLIQRECYTANSNMNMKLNKVIEDNIIKVKTRLEYSGEEKDFIQPILLPGSNEIVRRLVQEKHRHMCHAGAQTLMASLRNSFWIVGVRKLVKNVVAKCIICKRYKAKHYVVPEPPLPADRVKTTAPFEVTGIDLAGPLFLKDNQKCWIVLFTCAVYRAIHLELTESLSTNSFLMVLRRFLARRGRARVIYTDNGTNFVGAANLLQGIDWQEVEEATNAQQIQWKFSVPAAPWWGGWWERLIRVVKDMLRRILGRASVNWIELSTILCDCEYVINSRPLTYMEMGDMRPLTPLLFLQSIPTGETYDLDQIDEKNAQARYRYLQKLRQDFRTRFKSEYLSLLVSKGKADKREPKVGEYVLIEAEGSRIHWPVGIVREVYAGRDGNTRVAKVQTSGGFKVRAFQRLYPLELSSVSQEWLTNIPQQAEQQRSNAEDVPNCSAPPNLPVTRSGRTVKVPFRFLK